jgi:multidrug resistance protein, MATE family
MRARSAARAGPRNVRAAPPSRRHCIRPDPAGAVPARGLPARPGRAAWPRGAARWYNAPSASAVGDGSGSPVGHDGTSIAAAEVRSWTRLEGRQVDSEPSAARKPRTITRLVSLATPVLLANSSVMIMVAVDTYFIGKMSDDKNVTRDALAGIAFAAPILWSVLSLFNGAIAAINTFAAQVWGQGEGKRHRLGLYFSQAAGLGIIFSVPTILLGIFTPHIFRLLPMEPSVYVYASTYAQIRFLGLGFSFVSLAASGLFEGIGRMLIPTVVAILMNVLDGFLCWILVFGKFGVPALGVAGAATASVTSAAFGLCVFAAFLLRPRFWNDYLRPTLCVPGGKAMREFLKIAIPQGFGWFLEASLWTVFLILVASLGSTVASAQQVATAVLLFSFLPGGAISTATTTLVGQAIGAGSFREARRVFWHSLALTGGYMGTAGLVFFAARRDIVSFFNDDPAIIAVGSVILIYAAVWQVFDALYTASAGSLRGAGDTFYTMLIYFGFGWIVFLPSAYLACHVFHGGVQGAWATAAGFIAVAGVCAFIRWQRGGWERIRICQHDHDEKN